MPGIGALLPYVPTAISAIGALASGDTDPDKWRRMELKKLIDEIRSVFPRLADELRSREAVERGGMIKRMTDVGATGRMPRNVIAQNIGRVSLGSQRNLNEALARLEQQKLGTLEGLGGLIQGVPRERESLWPGLLGLSLQSLLNRPSGEGESDGLGDLIGILGGGAWDLLSGLFPSTPSAGGLNIGNVASGSRVPQIGNLGTGQRIKGIGNL